MPYDVVSENLNRLNFVLDGGVLGKRKKMSNLGYQDIEIEKEDPS